MVFESSDVVSIRTVMRIPYSKHGATLDTRRVRLSNPFDRNLLDLRLVWNTRKSLVIRPIYRLKYFGHSGWYFGQPWRTGGAKTRKEQTKELSERSRFYRLVRDKAARLVGAQGADGRASRCVK
jgi:hypothetical protein